MDGRRMANEQHYHLHWADSDGSLMMQSTSCSIFLIQLPTNSALRFAPDWFFPAVVAVTTCWMSEPQGNIAAKSSSIIRREKNKRRINGSAFLTVMNCSTTIKSFFPPTRMTTNIAGNDRKNIKPETIFFFRVHHLSHDIAIKVNKHRSIYCRKILRWIQCESETWTTKFNRTQHGQASQSLNFHLNSRFQLILQVFIFGRHWRVRWETIFITSPWSKKLFSSFSIVSCVQCKGKKKNFFCFPFSNSNVAWCGRANNLRQDVVGPRAQGKKSLVNLFIIHFVSRAPKAFVGRMKERPAILLHVSWLLNLSTRAITELGEGKASRKFT